MPVIDDGYALSPTPQTVPDSDAGPQATRARAAGRKTGAAHAIGIRAAAVAGLASCLLLGPVPAHASSAVAIPALTSAPGTAHQTAGGPQTRERAPDQASAATDCTGVEPDDKRTDEQLKKDEPYLCDNWRLGPKDLPTSGPVADLLKGYDRLGGKKTPKEFLDTYWDPTGGSEQKGDWRYPPEHGFVIGKRGRVEFVTKNLPKDLVVSRFGPEKYGDYLALANASFAKRGLPPSSLDTREDGCQNGFHLYKVIQPITGEEGFLAPAFGQPGLGAQYFSKSGGLIWSVEEFVNRGYLKRLNCESKR